MKQDGGDHLVDHLVGRRVLTTIEQQWLDLDGDGRLTSRDLLLSRSRREMKALGAVVPERRTAHAGGTVRCRLLGGCPDDLRATVMVGGRKVELPVITRPDGKQCRLEIELPSTLLQGARQRTLSILVVARGVLPRSIVMTLLDPNEPA